MRNKFRTLLLALAVLISGCSQQATIIPACDTEVTSISHTFLITATNREMNAVMRQIGASGSTCKIDEVIYTHITYNNNELVLFRTGIGPEAAKTAMVTTIDNFARPKKMVFSGIAGGLDPNLSSGQIIVVANWHPLDNYDEVVSVDTELLKLINPNYIVANGVSADHFVSNGSEVFSLTQATIVDMETYFIAKLASENDIPFIAFRSISDMANGTKKEEHFQLAADNSARAALEFIATAP